MQTNREKQLTIALLTEKLQKLTGKKVIMKEGWSDFDIRSKVEDLIQCGEKSFDVGYDDDGEYKEETIDLTNGWEPAYHEIRNLQNNHGNIYM